MFLGATPQVFVMSSGALRHAKMLSPPHLLRLAFFPLSMILLGLGALSNFCFSGNTGLSGEDGYLMSGVVCTLRPSW